LRQNACYCGEINDRGTMSWWSGRDGEANASAEFNRSLMREMLLTQQLRIKVLIVTAALFVVLLSLIDIFEPDVVAHVWQTGRQAFLVQGILLSFILFECWVYSQVAHCLKRNRDVPPLRR
jgi:adenylate cyclase